MSASTADWLQAWGTVAGTIFAAAAAISAFLVLRREIMIHRRDENDLRASTARSILLTTGQPHGKWATSEADGLITSIDLNLTNFSRYPIVEFSLSAERLDGGPQFIGLTGDVLGPGDTVTKTWRFEPTLRWPSSGVPTDLMRMKAMFTDEHGLRWERVDRNQPCRIFATAEVLEAERDNGES